MGALLVSVCNSYFATLTPNAKTAMAVQDIESNRFWKASYCLLIVIFPVFRVLRYCDANKSAMDKIFHLCDRAQNALMRSSSFLSDHSLFGYLEEEFIDEVYGELEEVFGIMKDDLNEIEELKISRNRHFSIIYLLKNLTFSHNMTVNSTIMMKRKRLHLVLMSWHYGESKAKI